MDFEEIIKDTVDNILTLSGCTYDKINISQNEKGNYLINVESQNPNIIIGYRGETIQAFQHLLKVLVWKQTQADFTILLDVDNYRQRQDHNILKLAKRELEHVRKNGRPQALPPMSPYLRRKIHLLCMEAGNEDIETVSTGEGSSRRITIKLK